MEVIPGIYLLDNIIYRNIEPYPIIKTRSSIDVGRRVKSSDYRTILLSKHRPIYLGSIHPKDYKTKHEIQYVERIIHHMLKSLRIDPKRELFNNVTLDNVISIFEYLGIDHTVIKELPKDELYKKEYDFVLNEIDGISFYDKEDINVQKEVKSVNVKVEEVNPVN